MSTKQFPCEPRTPVGGLLYFGRMLDKIRRHARGELRDEYLPNMGKGMDSRLCNFLHVDYAALKALVLDGASDDAAFEWCTKNGRPLNADDVIVWNDFVSKRGWNDQATPVLDKQKAESGLGHRADLRTFFEFWDVDEGRKP
jgi:gluconokinase